MTVTNLVITPVLKQEDDKRHNFLVLFIFHPSHLKMATLT
jgi:hypothetical protein